MAVTKLSDEQELLAKLRSGDKDAFVKFYHHYYASLYLHAYNRLRDRETARDIVQDLFTAIWAKRNELELSHGLSSYLYRSIRNRVIDHISRQQSSSAYISSFATFLDEPEGTTDHLIREKQLMTLIDEEISKLSPQVRRVFELSRREHLSHKEIAVELGLSEQTVRGYVKDALKILRMRFGVSVIAILLYWL